MAANTQWVFKKYSNSKRFKENEISYIYSDAYHIFYRTPSHEFDCPQTLTLTPEELGLTGTNPPADVEKEKILLYVNKLENRKTAIALLESYKTERKNIQSEFKVSAPVSYFFETICLRSLLGIPMDEKLAAAEKIITWLKEPRTTQETPELNLSERDIEALTDSTLGRTIENIMGLDPEFKAAFESTQRDLAIQPPKIHYR